jgi:hypothetical protein
VGKKKKTLIGYSYFLGMHQVICHSADSILRVDVGEKQIFSGNVTTNTDVNVNLPELFGGQMKEGGVIGLFTVLFGGPAQGQDAYLVSQLGAGIPAFRGVVSIVIKKMYLASMSPYIKPWQFIVKRIPGKSWYPAKADINNGSANAAHIIYDCFTNPSWGMGYSDAILDLPSFQACADKLFTEGLGLSFILSNTDSIESFMQQVCKHVAGTLYTDPVSGKFVMGLLRDDYNVALLTQYNESNIIELISYEKPSPAEMINEIVVKYRPRGTGQDDSVTVQDLASIQSQGGVISKTVDYTGIDTQQNAGRVASRELRTSSTPLTRVKFTSNRTAWQEKIGGVIKFSWTAHRVSSMVLRIVAIDFGTLDASTITITAVEDVFGLPFAAYMQPQDSLWVDPIQPPSVLTTRSWMEATYWDLGHNGSIGDLASLTATTSFGVGAAGQPAQASPNFELWTKPSGGSYTYADQQSYARWALTSGGANRIQTSVVLNNVRGNMANVISGTYAKWENELIRFDSYDVNTGILTMGRGVIDTVPAEHPSGSAILFLEQYQAIDDTVRAAGETALARMLMRTGSALMPIASVPEDSLTFVGRMNKPYPPARFIIRNNTPEATTSVVMYGALDSMSWNHRDRTQQLANLNDQNYGNIGPEVGVTYTIRAINIVGGATLVTTTGLTGTTLNYGPIEGPIAVNNLRLQLWSERAGAQSLQVQTYDIERHGLGFNLGSELGGTL